jgi:hypothetical protein
MAIFHLGNWSISDPQQKRKRQYADPTGMK